MLRLAELEGEMKFTIPLPPAGQMRPRATIRGKHAGVYKAAKQRGRERDMETLLAPYRPASPLLGPLWLGIKVYYPLPKRKSKAWYEAARAGRHRPTVKPDLSNLIKHVEDCLANAAFFLNDKQIVGYLPETGKYYDDGDGVRWELVFKRQIQAIF
jgi:Holliday junction resolvase RusA-like endonuclease